MPSVNDADASTANEIQTITAGTGMTVTPSGINYTVTNAAPDQTVVLADGGAGNVTIGGTYPNLTIDVLSLDDADADPTNEIQDISTDATAGNITLSSGSTLALNVDDADADPTNEIQDISTDATAGNITLSSGSTLALNVDDADADPTNEIQDISTDATAGNITLSSGSTLALNVDDADADPTNEIQDISTDATAGNITLSSGSTLALNVDDADADPTNEIQDISTDATAGNITLSSGSTLALNVDDADPDPTNEIQDISTDATAGNITLSSGSTLALNVNDADADPTNEIQDLDLTANTLTITNNGSATNIDLSPYQQDISISGNTLSISGGTGFNLTATSPNPMEVLKWNGTNWDTGTDNVNDGDSNPSNELQTLNLTGTNLTISGFPLSPVDLSPIGVLPDQTGHTGEYLTTNGTGASWNALGALASQNSVTTGFITDGTIAAADLNATVAGNGLSGGAGTPLAVNLSGTSGLQITTDQLEMPTLFPGGTTVGGGATTAINSLTFDAKGRFVSATTIIVLLSDKRLKKEITQLDSSLEKLMQLNGYNYYLKSDSLSKELKTGVIAQEVEKVFPNLILNRPDGFLAVDYQGLIPILLEALKEEHARVSGLENELAQMKVQLSSNDERFKALEAKLDLLIQSTAKATTSSQE
ncbi:hypothetical protein IMPERIA89_430016 [Imperialibacter sp. 89]|nr:hypothetical protein IMPERIA89_430016 [Imperialibacter sp. 89]CAD5291975.1 hypothetical protein IMPERIA75_640016 [Imperialibacter sp. 75]